MVVQTVASVAAKHKHHSVYNFTDTATVCNVGLLLLSVCVGNHVQMAVTVFNNCCHCV